MRYGPVAGGMVLVFSIGMVGCARMNTRVVEKPRVDQELPGNRGYLAGLAPAPVSRKSTRQMIETNIELPTGDELNPWRKPMKVASSAPVSEPTPAMRMPVQPEIQQEPQSYPEMEPESMAPASASVGSTAYTVQSGDTLEKISKKFYGTTKKWRTIYDANRSVLRSPDRVYPGQKLMIPSEKEEVSGPRGGQDFK